MHYSQLLVIWKCTTIKVKYSTAQLQYMLYYVHSSFNPSQQCCYGSDGNILTGTDGGSAYSVYPNNWKSFLGK